MRPLPAATPTRNVLSSHDVKVGDSCPARDINMGCAGKFFCVSLHRPQHTPYSTFQGLSKPWLSNSGPHLYVCVVHTGRWRRLHPNWFTWAMLPRKTCQERKPERDARQYTYRREIHSDTISVTPRSIMLPLNKNRLVPLQSVTFIVRSYFHGFIVRI